MHKLVEAARREAMKFYHGYVSGTVSNLEKILECFPGWTKEEADGLWCAAFVYHCCRLSGFGIPIRPRGAVTCHLGGCIAWEEWALVDARVAYFGKGGDIVPQPGDIVLFDRVFHNSEHDHIGVVLEVKDGSIVTAEGNFNNVSCIVERKMDEHIRGLIRIPENYVY